MTSMLCVTVVQVALALTGAETAAVKTEAVSADAESYAEAHRQTVETGKPLVVMVSTDWCPPCQVMKKTVLPRVRERGVLRKVVFAMVNPDRDAKLAQELTGGGPIPQLVMFRKTAEGWKRQKLIGGQSVESVEKFINDGLAMDEEEKKAAADADEKNSNDSDQATVYPVDVMETEEAALEC
jgi:thioredoxin-like negative regulator of GroEL